MTTINYFTLFKEKFAVYCENYMKPINTLCTQNAELQIINASGTYSYHLVFKVLSLFEMMSEIDAQL
jgi:hypothetical protein